MSKPTRSANGRPRLTIGVPVHNGGRYLRETLDSLLAQTYTDFELILSDNASTDDTEEICRSYAEADSRVVYVRSDKDVGAAGNFNRLVELADTELFKWATADDVCKPELVERCIEQLDRDPGIVLASVRTVFMDEAGVPIRNLDPGWDLRSENVCERFKAVVYAGGHWVNADALAGVVRLDALRRTTLMPRYQGGDKRTIAELSLMGRFYEVPEYLYLRRLHPSSSGQHNPEYAKDRAKSIEWMTEFFKASKMHITLPTVTLLLDHLRVVARSSLSLREKASLFGAVGRFANWKRNLLLRELSAAIQR